MDRRDVLKLLGLSAVAPMAGRFGLVGCSEVGPGVQSLQDGVPRTVQQLAPGLELALSAVPEEVSLLPGEATSVWRFRGEVVRGRLDALRAAGESYLGPTLRLRRGERVRIRFANGLPEPSVIHWHGLDVPESADGHPRFAFPTGVEYVYDFTVANRSGTYWYHPHPDMRTGPQVHRGLAGLLLVDDEEEAALGLPAAESELVCVIQDRSFDEANQFAYPESAGMGGGPAGRGGMGRGRGMGGMGPMGMAGMTELMNGVLGDRVLVNGVPNFTAPVEAGWVRLRLLNGSNARTYKLGWSDGRPMTVIGGDGGLLERAVSRDFLTLAPGQRADLVQDLSDLSEGARIRLRSLAYPPEDAGNVGMMMGATMGMSAGPAHGAALDVLTIDVRGRNTRPLRLPERLSEPGPGWDAAPSAPVRRVALAMGQMQWTLGGRTFELEGVSPEETVEAGSTHVWELVNVPNPMGMAMAHPIHIHGRQFRVLGRSGGMPDSGLRAGIVDEGWTDTVLVLPGETVRIQIRFSEHPGLYLYHCHILEHEDLGMMRNFRIV
ncbi:MAG: multicopper oxidase domain-containing protein [Gemmatimonadota bacterium]